MDTPKSAIHEHQLTVTLTDEQYELLEAFAAEKGIDNLALALPETLRELVNLSDQLWDALFARSTAPLDKMAKQALKEHRAGLTEDLDLHKS
jgi:hypothetical protein